LTVELADPWVTEIGLADKLSVKKKSGARPVRYPEKMSEAKTDSLL
jgi:hypothetical protein